MSVRDPHVSQARRVGLVGCVKRKIESPAAAKDLYDSALFRGRRRHVERSCDRWFVLSAKHGLIKPEQRIDPYDVTLNDMSAVTRREWATRVLAQIDHELDPVVGTTFEVHAGANYRSHGLVAGLRERGAIVTNPTLGLRLGEQLRFYGGASVAGSPGPSRPTAPRAQRGHPVATRPRGSGGRYAALKPYLEQRANGECSLTFAQIERVLGRALPASARRYAAWWANSAIGHSHARCWLDAGWRVDGADLQAERVRFIRHVERDEAARR